MKLTINLSHSAEISVDFIIRRIRSYVASQGWSRTRIAKEAGFPHHTSLRDFETPDWNPTAEVLRKLEAIVPEDFYLAPADIEMPESPKESEE